MTAHFQDVIKTSLKVESIHGLLEKYFYENRIDYIIDGDEINFTTGVNLFSWGERIRIEINEGLVLISSRCKLKTQAFDWGKNKRNVAELKKLITLNGGRGLNA